MNKFVQKRSGLFLFTMWVFLASFFADSANLDDIFPSNYVLHDDDEVCGVPSSPVPHDESAGLPQPLNGPRKDVQVVIDQDSPALASDPLGPPPTTMTLFEQDEQVTVTSFSSSHPFYLLHCTLLI